MTGKKPKFSRKKPVLGKQKEHFRTYKNGNKVKVNPGNKKSSKTVQSKLQTTQNKRPMSEFEEPIRLMVAALRLPDITAHGNAFPESLKDRIPADRMLQLHKSSKEFKEYATDSEVLGYLSTISLGFPLNRDYAEIMEYLSNKVMPNKVGWLKKQGGKVELDVRQKNILNDLKRWIRKKQWGAFKG